MQTIKILSILLLTIVLAGCVGGQNNQTDQEQTSQTQGGNMENERQMQNLSKCEKAGGELIEIRECDGSKAEWCIISDREECYADQVENGKCTVGEYNEKLGGVVGIPQRVLCGEVKE